MTNQKRAMRDVFLETLIAKMDTNDDIFFVTADLGSPVLDILRERFPDRYINVGIAEQNLINVSTGLALEGFTVYAYAIAPFITMRCYEQVRVNLAILSQVRETNVNLIGVGAGYSYVVSGPTHQCMEDLSIMRTLPNIELFSPADYVTVENFVEYSLKNKSPKYIRLDAQPATAIYPPESLPDIERGFAEIVKGDSVCIVSTGYMTRKALEVADKLSDEGIIAGVVDFFMLSTFDERALCDVLGKYSRIVSFEEGFVGKGGLDSLLLHFINRHGISVRFDGVGLRSEYNFELGSRDALHNLNDGGVERVMGILRKAR